jgi:hypothetical protein
MLESILLALDFHVVIASSTICTVHFYHRLVCTKMLCDQDLIARIMSMPLDAGYITRSTYITGAVAESVVDNIGQIALRASVSSPYLCVYSAMGCSPHLRRYPKGVWFRLCP